jgi:hypothetical protein
MYYKNSQVDSLISDLEDKVDSENDDDDDG